MLWDGTQLHEKFLKGKNYPTIYYNVQQFVQVNAGLWIESIRMNNPALGLGQGDTY